MHLKSYQIDGRLLRTGAANFSASGPKRQDNYLIVIESAGAAASFKRNFDARFASGKILAAGSRLRPAEIAKGEKEIEMKKTIIAIVAAEYGLRAAEGSLMAPV
jgi:phosphatidylserine/phosphatidylglycerophosphate/cardiolipin synthase-like enzyme